MTYKPIVKSKLPDDIRVFKLIDSNHRWDKAFIHKNFAADDAEAIKTTFLLSKPTRMRCSSTLTKRGFIMLKVYTNWLSSLGSLKVSVVQPLTLKVGEQTKS